ncbi:MAG: SigF/SigG family RNA polymerase sporulation sigma factor [Lachnospiraceae bacterium]|nr:SigF/SigG family RNA polymerase sporulation sigma factor [Lachnospiraceae bacterium]MBP3609976.1 SigF/SigG family RNA polymerase sporulation sigma factor [Lachnospiraceae bacterium]
MDIQLLIRKAQEGDKLAREQVINDNVGLVWSIVRRFLGRGQEADDLFQIGVIGLMKAVDKFDLSYDVMFSTYAVPMIAGEIKRYLRDNNSLIKMSRSIKENGWKIKAAKEKLAYELGRDATMEELAAATELSMEDIVMAMEANSEIESIYKTVYQGDGNEIYLVDRIREEKNEAESLIDRMTVQQLLDSLTEEERLLITSRYFEDKTQVETAKLLGISQVQVSRLEKKILLKMRKNVQG